MGKLKINMCLTLLVAILLALSTSYSMAFVKIAELATTDSKDEFFRVALGDGIAFWSHYGEGIYAWDVSNPVMAGHKISNDDKVTVISASGNRVAWIDHSDDIQLWEDGFVQEVEDDVVDTISQYDTNVAFVEEDHEDFFSEDTEIFLRVPGRKIQVSDNDYDDKQPSVFGQTVAWVGKHDDNYDLFYWDGKNEYKLTDSDGDDLDPSLDHGAIAWTEWDGDDFEIFYWAGGANIQITDTDDDEDDISPVLRDGKVVWIKDNGECQDIYLWDGASIQQLTDQCYDEISSLDFNGEAILWSARHDSEKSVFYALLPGVNRHLTGWWYDPSQPGTGLATEVRDAKIFLTWFVYDGFGRTTWYSAGGEMSGSTTFSGKLYSWKGWPWGTPYYPPRPELVGIISVNFDWPERGKVTFSVSMDNKLVTKTFTSFMADFAPGDEDYRHLTGWWYDPAFNGMGFFLDARGGKMALAWYNYREDASARWFTSSNFFPNGSQLYMGNLDGWQGGPCAMCPYVAQPSPIPAQGGPITITFTDRDHALVTVGEVTLNLQRFQMP
ncbi:MAG: hypothetical protein GXO58_04700 [Thermodesulfobacteria bacterium]|nr:hypothetical protein [Thermodesulfobacteriota bacterium]